jgi:tetratricopeptide (TPR) repeat protein
MRKLIISIILIASVCVYAQTDDKTALKELNQKLVDSYKNNKLDDALKYANQAVELSLKIYGTDNVETAVAYSNLGTIQREKKKFKESVLSFQKTNEIYLKISSLKGNSLIESYENLAFSQFLDKKYDESIFSYLKAIELSEIKSGKENKELFSPTLDLANAYSKNNNFEKADEYYLKSAKLALKYFGQGSLEFLKIDFLRSSNCERNKELDADYNKARKELFPKKVDSIPVGPIYAGVIKGKATDLARPVYPAEARERRLEGKVSVRVLIDEQGNVIYAKADCGQGILGDISEDAALKSKFSRTTLSGNPVKIIGILTYNFSFLNK